MQALVDTHDAGNVSAAAARTGLTQPALHRLLKGETPNPSVRTVTAIAAAYHISLDALLTGRDDPTSVAVPSSLTVALDELRSALVNVSREVQAVPVAGHLGTNGDTVTVTDPTPFGKVIPESMYTPATTPTAAEREQAEREAARHRRPGATGRKRRA